MSLFLDQFFSMLQSQSNHSKHSLNKLPVHELNSERSGLAIMFKEFLPQAENQSNKLCHKTHIQTAHLQSDSHVCFSNNYH